MSVNGVSSFGSIYRIGGLATGLDTDQLVSDLMNVEKAPLVRLQQNKQLSEWKRDEFRDIINLVRGLKDEYFNVLKPSSNMLSQSTYKVFSSETTDSNYVTATATSAALEGSHTISITQVATADKAVSSAGITKSLTSTSAISTGVGSDVTNASGKTINITLDGIEREITLGTYTDATTVADMSSDIQSKIDTAFGSGKITVTESGGQITFDTTGGASKISLASGTTDDALTYLQIDSGSSNRINTSDTLETLASKLDAGLTFDASDNVVFSINDKEFTFSKTTSLSSMISSINADTTANVNITYDETVDKFSITSKQLGDGDNIRITQTGGTFFDGASKITTAAPVTTEGVDAIVKIDGETLTRSSNNFTINNITYNLKKAHTDPATQSETISITKDTDAIYNNITNFVEKYNEIIGKINDKLIEKYDRNYKPLTDDQKEEMTDDQIETWENKAKKGLLRSDNLLQGLIDKTRRALFDEIDGLSVNLKNIGIDTGSYLNKGKLIIDETTLKEAITNDADSVMNIFAKESESQPSYSHDLTASEKTTRYNEEGVANRLYDVFEEYISTIRDSDGKKGLLLEKAGIEGDVTEYGNILNKEIAAYNEKIDEMLDKMEYKENWYYQRFAALEKAIAQMNNQSSWLSGQLG